MTSNFRKTLSVALFSAAATLSSGIEPVSAQNSYYRQNRAYSRRVYNNYNRGYNAPIGVSLNGRLVPVGSVAPVQINNRVLVPLRGVLEAMGATVGFDSNTQTVLANRGNTQISLRIGSRQAFVNGQRRALDVPAQLFRGRTLVPLRFVSESLGANVSWNTAQRIVFISTNGRSYDTYVPPTTVVIAPPYGGTYYPPSTIGSGLVTLYGSVTRVLGGRRLEVLTDRGELVEVRVPQENSTDFDINDRVVFSGVQSDEFFRAESVRPMRNSQRWRGAMRGTVVARLSSTRLLVRTPNGRTVTVVTNTPFAASINAGDVVRIPGGTGEGDFVRAQRVVLMRNGNNAAYGRRVNFVATVVRDDLFGDLLQVRGENGVLYIVRYPNHPHFAKGDRVRIVGTANQGITNATSIKML